MPAVTQILEAMRIGGDETASQQLLDLVYEELRQLAAAKLVRENPSQTLQATALVHEAWMRLSEPDTVWENRGHFFGAAAEAMRRILIERARARHRLKRGGSWIRKDWEEVTMATEDPDEVVLAIHEALENLAAQDPVKAEIVKMRYFIGLNHQEIAEALGIGESTVRRHWAFARCWLYAELKSDFS